MRRNQVIVSCASCSKPVSVAASRTKRSKHLFCNSECANAYQARNKVAFVCKVCSGVFSVPKSEAEKSDKREHTKQYCSVACRNNDKAAMTLKAQKMNETQRNKMGLNKLELAGRQWLEGMGFIRDVDFKEQVLLFDKFCVDAVIESYKLVIQFDGEYWHNNESRNKLDKSQDSYLQKAGYRIFRITDKEMYTKDLNLHSKLIQRWMNALMGFECAIKFLDYKTY